MPDTAIDVNVKAALPVFVTVTLCAAEVAPAGAVKLSELVLNETEGVPGELPDPP